MTISLSQLESHLWESANILRGPVDEADFKTYIFPLVFFKRICAVWDVEYQEIINEIVDKQPTWFAESPRFQTLDHHPICEGGEMLIEASCKADDDSPLHLFGEAT